mmetsp:Transcript_12343/g.22208  ORF Transcript_12343/g.22208 Transcript_12343/m.22208 type:complete len:247 (-) Transcript_12343:107-847(-)
MMANARKEMVLNLGGEPEGHMVPEIGIRGEVAALCNLHLSPRLVLPHVRVEDGMCNLRARQEDQTAGPVHAKIAEPGRTKEVVPQDPESALEQESSNADVNVVDAKCLSHQEVNKRLGTQLENHPDGQERRGQHLEPARESVGDPNVLDIHIPLLVSVGVVAHNVTVMPTQRWAHDEVSQEHGNAVDPLIATDLLVRALVCQPSSDGAHDEASHSTAQRRADHKEEDHHDEPTTREGCKNLRAHPR